MWKNPGITRNPGNSALKRKEGDSRWMLMVNQFVFTTILKLGALLLVVGSLTVAQTRAAARSTPAQSARILFETKIANHNNHPHRACDILRVTPPQVTNGDRAADYAHAPHAVSENNTLPATPAWQTQPSRRTQSPPPKEIRSNKPLVVNPTPHTGVINRRAGKVAPRGTTAPEKQGVQNDLLLETSKKHVTQYNNVAAGTDQSCKASETSHHGFNRKACKLQNNLENWQSELKDDCDRDFLIKGISEGFDILEGKLPEFRADCENYKSATMELRDKVESQIKHEVSEGNYIKVPHKPKVVSSLGAILKSSGSVRIIHDLSRPNAGVNQFVLDSSCQYSSVDFATKHIHKGAWLSKIDLRSGYRSIPINERCLAYTGLSWVFKNEHTRTFMVDARLPFGSKKACQIFTAISNAIARMLQRKNILVINYLDDILVISRSKAQAWLDLNEAINLLTKLGFDIAWEKLETPTQSATFLGIQIDSVQRTLALPPEKLQAFQELLLQWSSKKRVSKRDLLSLLGRLNWASRVVRGGRTFLRRLIDLSMRLKKNHHRIWLNAEAKADIMWWVNCMDMFHGNTRFIDDMRPPVDKLSTDASRVSGGGAWGRDWFHINFGIDFPGFKDSHINTLELLTVLVAARRWGHAWGGTHIRILCDNTSACNAINKGTSRSPEFMRCLRELFWLSVLNNFRVTATHIKGSLNNTADMISRLHEPPMRDKFVNMYIPLNDTSCLKHMSMATFLSLQDGTPILK